LGASVGFIGGVGDDAFWRLMRARFEAEGVDAAQMQVLPGRTTGVAFVAYAPDGSREVIENLKQSPGGEKIVLCYMSVGQAERYRFYWHWR
jgi:sugar/nucleoside kinase (ribokinase family)